MGHSVLCGGVRDCGCVFHSQNPHGRRVRARLVYALRNLGSPRDLRRGVPLWLGVFSR
jgi:hypothetical protein